MVVPRDQLRQFPIGRVQGEATRRIAGADQDHSSRRKMYRESNGYKIGDELGGL